MRISDWSSDVCSSDLYITFKTGAAGVSIPKHLAERFPDEMTIVLQNKFWGLKVNDQGFEVGLTFNQVPAELVIPFSAITAFVDPARSEEHTSELQSLMRISYAVFCLKKKKKQDYTKYTTN